MELENLKELVRKDKYHYSRHALVRKAERGFTDRDVRGAILEGRLLETYEKNARGKSFLLLGNTDENEPIYVLLGYNRYRDEAKVITAYYPESLNG